METFRAVNYYLSFFMIFDVSIIKKHLMVRIRILYYQKFSLEEI